MFRVPHKFPPFLPRLRVQLVVTAFVQRVLRYYGEIRLLLIVRTQITDPPSCAVQVPPSGTRKSGDLTAPAHRVSIHARVYDIAGFRYTSHISLYLMLPSVSLTASASRNRKISLLNILACMCPCQRFAHSLVAIHA
ncbi:MAG: hypothetical protein DESF_01354 [Desulfovibrio sp.]